ncbi:MAG: hypothetical protein LBV46_02220 [Bacteroidales bacterium]|nr:hypothetical protein [Bacteroidales bacterium]
MLMGYWHNWKSPKAGNIPFNAIDERYDIIMVAFTMPKDTSMVMQFTPFGMQEDEFRKYIAAYQDNGKKVLLSVGGATSSLDLTTEGRKANFINSIVTLLLKYEFDGIDINIEHGESILNKGGTIRHPENMAQLYLIGAIREIMSTYSDLFHRRMLLTLAPETAYVQGGQSAYKHIWGGYLPILDALRDSIFMVQVQLYNSGTMLDLNGTVRTVGTPEFVVSMTEALLSGFQTKGGFFKGFHEQQVAITLPACKSAAGSGFIDPTILSACIKYLTGLGKQVGTYKLKKRGGYPQIGGLTVWSINWEANENCNGLYPIAEMWRKIGL